MTKSEIEFAERQKKKLVELCDEVINDCYNSTCEKCTPGTQHYPECISIRVADHLISHGVTVQEWISVKDRLPEPWKDVLAFYEDKTISIDAMSDGGKWYSDYVSTNEVTHWMPLPQPPKGE